MTRLETPIASVRKPTILLLCSDPVMRAVIGETLETEGYTVLAAGSLGTAVDRLKEYRPDLLIVRPYVDNMTGHDAATYLRTKRPGMRVLMLTGFMDDERIRSRASLQAFDIFPKPFTAGELTKEVGEILAR
jgi:two-component system cell cycle sensor histidine kinase/response regulator CckA